MKTTSKAVNNELKEILVNKPTQDSSNAYILGIVILIVTLAGTLTGCGVINLY